MQSHTGLDQAPDSSVCGEWDAFNTGSLETLRKISRLPVLKTGSFIEITPVLLDPAVVLCGLRHAAMSLIRGSSTLRFTDDRMTVRIRCVCARSRADLSAEIRS